MALVLSAGPSSEPVTTTEAKTWLRVDHSNDDTLIGNLCKAARLVVQKYLRQAIGQQTWIYTLDAFPATREIEIPMPPLVSVTSVKYYDVDDELQTLNSGDYIVDTSSSPGRIVLVSTATWPATSLRPNAVQITYVCGTTPTEEQKVAILLKVADFYQNRESAFEALLRGDRLYSF